MPDTYSYDLASEDPQVQAISRVRLLISDIPHDDDDGDEQT